MNNIFNLAGFAVITAGFAVLLKQYKPEYSFGIILASGIIIILNLMSMIGSFAEGIYDMFLISGISDEKYKIIFRCLGICIITKTASECCSDCGLGSMASKIDFTGKIFIMAAAFPLFEEIIEIIKILIEI